MGVDRARLSNVVPVSSAASTAVRGADVSRCKLIFSNADAAAVIYLGLSLDGSAPTAVVGQGIRLGPSSQPFTLEGYYGPVAARASAGTPNLGVVDL